MKWIKNYFSALSSLEFFCVVCEWQNIYRKQKKVDCVFLFDVYFDLNLRIKTRFSSPPAREGTQVWHTGRIPPEGLETMWRRALELPGAAPARTRKAVPCTEGGTLVLNANPGSTPRAYGARALWGGARARGTHAPGRLSPRSRPGLWLVPHAPAPPIPGADSVPTPAWSRPPKRQLGSTFPAVSMAARAGGFKTFRRPLRLVALLFEVGEAKGKLASVFGVLFLFIDLFSRNHTGWYLSKRS